MRVRAFRLVVLTTKVAEKQIAAALRTVKVPDRFCLRQRESRRCALECKAETTNFYDENADAYAALTVHADMLRQYEKFSGPRGLV